MFLKINQTVASGVARKSLLLFAYSYAIIKIHMTKYYNNL